MVTEAEVRAFLVDYGAALGRSDLAAVTAAWQVPAMILADQGARLVSEAAAITQFFGAAVPWYRSQGLMGVHLAEARIEPLGERLVEVDARWAAYGADGAPRPDGDEHSRYILYQDDEGKLRFLVAIGIKDRV
jgi:hypothetical protein